MRDPLTVAGGGIDELPMQEPVIRLQAAALALRFNESAAVSTSPLMPALRRIFDLASGSRSAQPEICTDSCGPIPTLAGLSMSLSRERPTSYLTRRLDTWREHCRVRAALAPLRPAHERNPWLKIHHHYFWRGRYGKDGRRQRSGYDAHEETVLRIVRPVAAEVLGIYAGALAISPAFDRLLLATVRLACSASPATPAAPTERGEAPRADVLVVGGGSVGLMTAIAARLAGAHVVLWERRAQEARTRLHMIDVHELYCVEDGTSGALALVEALGLLDFGLRGFWEPLWHRRDSSGRVVAAAYGEDGHDELREGDINVDTDDYHWIVNLQIATLERALLFAAAVSGVNLYDLTTFVAYHPPSSVARRWTAVGCPTAVNSKAITTRSDAEIGIRHRHGTGPGTKNGVHTDTGGGTASECVNASFDVLVAADGTRSSVRAFAGVEMVQPVVCVHARGCNLHLDHAASRVGEECDASFRLSADCRQPIILEKPSARTLRWQPSAVSLALTLPRPCERGHALPTDYRWLAQMKLSIASLAEAPWDNSACRVTLGLLPRHSSSIMAHGWHGRNESLVQFAIHVLRLMGRQTDGARDFSVFTNTMRYARRSQLVLAAQGETAVVLLKGEALAEAYYRDGSGLNVGLHGATSIGRLFVLPLLSGSLRPNELSGLAEKAADVTESQRDDVVLGGLSRAVVDVLTAEYQPLSARFATSVFGVRNLMDALERSGGNCSVF